MSRKKPTAPPPEAPSNARVDVSVGPNDSRSLDRVKADLSVTGLTGNAALVGAFNARSMGADYSLTDLCHALNHMVRDSKGGSTTAADSILIPQVSVMNAIFGECMRRALANMSDYPQAAEMYMRLGLKAQSQCRATLESLAKIKNPPNVAFVNQANIANGPQQVNNGVPAEPMPAPLRAGNQEKTPNELLETSNGEWLDPSEASQAIRRNKELAAVGEVHRADDVPRQSGVQP